MFVTTDQPSDGATGGSSGSSQSTGESSDSGSSSSQDAPPLGGSSCSGGSSSGGDNGDDDPRRYYRSEDHKSASDFECEEEKNDEEKRGDLATGCGDLKYTPENMVTYKLQPMKLASNDDHLRRINGPTLSDSRQVRHQSSSSSSRLAMFNFDRSQELKFGRMEKEPSVDQPATPEYQQEEISATSMEEEECITLSASSEAVSPGGIPMNMVCFIICTYCRGQ